MNATLQTWGWSEAWKSALAEAESEGEPGRVIAQHRGLWTVGTAAGPVRARTTSSRALPVAPVVGDWVVLSPPPTPSDPHSVVGVLPRRSAISRGAAGSETVVQVLAANVDVVWIVHGLDVPPNLRRIERSLALVWESGASPRVVLTKADLAEDVDADVARVRGVALGVPVVVASREDSGSVAALAETLREGETVALIGPSGVGKSTLVNLLAGAERAATGEVRQDDRKGRHTTTHRELFELPGGALLLDTPGLRELRVRTLDQGLAATFPDIDAVARGCRFRDCRHSSEPDCAVREAVASGSLGPQRLESYHKLLAEAAFEARKSDPLARAAAVSEHKTALKTMKHHLKRQERS